MMEFFKVIYHIMESLEGHFKMSNFDAMVLTNFIEDKRLKLSGLIFGEVWIRPSDLKYDLDVDISLKDGIYMEESFDEMVISLLYKDGVLHLDDFSMTERSLMAIEINGILPLNNYTLKKIVLCLKRTLQTYLSNFSTDLYQISLMLKEMLVVS